MKKFMEKLRSLGKKFIVILLIEAMMISTIPFNVNADEPRKNFKPDDFGFFLGRSNDLPLILSYSISVKKSLLMLSWNRTTDKNTKYYILSRKKDDKRFELVSAKEGITDTFWTANIADGQEKYFIVCSSEMFKKRGDGHGRYLFEDIDGRSNKIYIDPAETKKPVRPEFVDYNKNKKEAILTWSSVGITGLAYFLVFEKMGRGGVLYLEKDNVHVDKIFPRMFTTRYYVWAIDKNGNASNPLIYESKGINDNGSNDNTGIDGVYRIDETKITTITFHGVKLEIPAGATPTGTSIAISDLILADIENIDEKESANITYSQDNPGLQGYEIYFTGKSDNKFLKDIKLSLRYDKLMIPTSFTEDDVYAFYYDNSINGWRDLVRSNLDTTNGWVTAVTNHFCEFYAGTMSNAGEPPQSKGINTSPVNIAAVNPMAGIRGINPPSPNNQGTANVDYPISVPAGINGMTPGVSINYSSDAKLGNSGYGWNLSESAIVIDTTNSVPKYDGTDKLLFDGKEIVCVGNNTYRYKAEGAFSKIVYDTATGGFVVYQTDGSKLYYGDTTSSRIGQYKWYLSQIMDKFGNKITYQYEKYYGNLYISYITYGYNNCYVIIFNWIKYNNNYSVNSLISGVSIGNNMKLSVIQVNYISTLLKKYDLSYSEDFTLGSISEKNNTGTVLNDSSFGYMTKSPANPSPGNDTVLYNGLNYPMSDCDMNGDGLKDRVAFIYDPNESGHPQFFYVRINTGSGYLPTQQWTYKYAEHEADEEEFGILVDMNGDGFPDYVRYRPNTNGHKAAYYVFTNDSNKPTHFDEDQYTINLEDFAQGISDKGELLDMNGDGRLDRMLVKPLPDQNKINIYIQYNTGSGFSNTVTWTIDSTLIPNAMITTDSDGGSWQDMNGDGLPDRVYTTSYDASAGTGSYTIFFNNGNGFEEPMTWNVSRIVTNPVNTDLFPKPYTIPWSQYVNAWYDSSYGTVINSIAYSESISDINDDGIADRRQTRTFNYTYKVCYYVDQHDEQSFLQTNTWSESTVAYNTGKGFFTPSVLPNKSLLLSSITNLKTNTVTSLGYTQHILYSKDRFVLSSITTGNDDLSITTGISYGKGSYQWLEKEFYGFDTMTVSIFDTVKAVTNATVSSYYINSKSYKGIPYSIENTAYSYKDLWSPPTVKYHNKKTIQYQNRYLISGATVDTQVYYLYAGSIRNWLYDFNNVYIGKNPESQGDPVSDVSITFDSNGLPTGSTINSYGDPYNTNDDTITTTTNMIDTTAWHCQAATSETTDATASLTKLSGSSVEYNTDGSVHKKTAWNNNGTTPVDPWVEYGYNTSGEVTSVTGSNGQTVGFAYDYSNPAYYYKIITKTLPGEMTEITRLNYMGRVMSTTDVYGDTTRFVYDTTYEGRLVKVYEQGDTDGSSGTYDLPSKRYTYGTEIIAGQTYFKVKAEYKDTIAGHYLLAMFYTDALGMKAQTKVKSEVDGEMVWVVSGTTEYDQMGRPTKSRDIKTAALTDDTYIDTSDCDITGSIEYDDMSVPVKLSAKYSATQDMTINSEYNIVLDGDRLLAKQKIYDNSGHDTTTYMDMSGVQVKTDRKKDNGTISSTMEYNLSGYAKFNEGSGTNGDVLTGEKQYDSLGRLEWIKSPDAGKKQYNYNDKGLVASIRNFGKDKTGNTYKDTNFTYDTYNRITKIDYGAAENEIDYSYYPITGNDNKYNNGNIWKVVKGNGFAVEYIYEKYAISEKKTIEEKDYTTRYEYDIQGRIKTLTYPGGEVVTYTYNDGGHLVSIASPTVTYISNIQYDKYGQKTSATYGNGTVQTYTYDKYTGLLDTYVSTDKNGAKLLDYQYKFNMSGNITNIIDGTTSTQTYGYDLLGRLTSGAGTYTPENKSYNEAYTYDDINRITSKTKDGVTYNYSYNGSHGVTGIAGTDVSTGSATGRDDFTYDNYGKLTKKQSYNAANTLVGTVDNIYNAGSELTKINMGDYNLNFQYDAGGQRIVKSYKYKTYEISHMVYVNKVYTVRNYVNVDKHISDGNYIIATKVMNRDDKILYYSQNHIGSTAMLTDKNGAVFQKILYRPYGETWIAKGNSSNDIERYYTGQVLDKESGLYYYNARYYSPDVGAFITPDPAMASANHYAYANCNPVMYNDPTGFNAELAENALPGLVGIIAGLGLLVFDRIDNMTGNVMGNKIGEYFDAMGEMITDPQKIITYNPAVVLITTTVITPLIIINGNSERNRLKNEGRKYPGHNYNSNDSKNPKDNKDKDPKEPKGLKGLLTKFLIAFGSMAEKIQDFTDLLDQYNENTKNAEELLPKNTQPTFKQNVEEQKKAETQSQDGSSKDIHNPDNTYTPVTPSDPPLILWR